jgi:hypothetical protein
MKKLCRMAVTSLWLILIVALGVRLEFAWTYQHHHSRQALSVIPFMFESSNIGYSLATGQGFSSPFHVNTGPTAWMTPVYPAILAAIFRICGPYTFQSWVAAVFLNILFSTLACVPIFFAGKRIGGLGVAAGAAWLWALFPNAFQLAVESIWEASLAALLAATILWATLELVESTRLRDWCSYGLLWGLTLMTNAALGSALPFLLLWLMYRARGAGRPWLKGPALSLGIALLCCTPWTIRNYEVFHSFVPLRSVLGLQLWMGNNPQTKDVWLGEGHPIHEQAERDLYVQLGEIAYMRQKKADAIRYMFSHPAREVHLIAHRFISFWSGGTPHPFEDFTRWRSNWPRYVLLYNVAAALGALLGIAVLCLRRSEYAFPSAALPILYPCAYYLTLALPRYQLPIAPIELILAAIGVQGLAQWAVRIAGARKNASDHAARP